MNTDPTVHTPSEQAVIDEYQNAVDIDLVHYIERIRNNPEEQIENYQLKPVNERAATDIQRITGIDAAGNQTAIEARMIKHISAGINGQDETAYSIGNPEKRRFPASRGSSSKTGGAQNSRKPSADIIRTREGKSQARESIIPMLEKLDEDAVIYVKNENKFNKLAGLQSDNPPKLLAKVELVNKTIAQEVNSVNPSVPRGTGA